MAHFTAACDMICRLSPRLPPGAPLATQLDLPVWTPPGGPPPADRGRDRPAHAAPASPPAPSATNTRSYVPPPRVSTSISHRASAHRRHSDSDVLADADALAVMYGPGTPMRGAGGVADVGVPPARADDALLLPILSRLADMGFGDDALNRDVLAAVKLDEERAIAWLCDLASNMATSER
eukprot:4756828-Prymnesium_polylepis.1